MSFNWVWGKSEVKEKGKGKCKRNGGGRGEEGREMEKREGKWRRR